LPLSGDTPPALADPGVTLVSRSRTLYVYGGLANGEPHPRGYRIDLVTWDGKLLANGAAGPGGRTRPLVTWDPRRQRLWIAGGDAEGQSGVIPVWRYDAASELWREYRPVDLGAFGDGWMTGTFTREAPVALLMQGPDGGDKVQVVLTAESGGLGLRVRDAASGKLIAVDMSGYTTNKVTFYAKEGLTYALEVAAGATFGIDEAAAFELNTW
jgi:hypothetical protein